MTTTVKGKAFDQGKLVTVNDRIPFNLRELYSLGWHHTLGGVSVREEFSFTKINFFGSGVRDFSHVVIKIRKNRKYEEEKLKVDEPYWLEPGQSAIITNESQGKHVRLRVMRERPSTTQDRSRR